jgi:hypothetical protein
VQQQEYDRMAEFWMKDAHGGSDAFQAVGGIARRVKGQLEKLDAKSYSPVLNEFGITLWVDGSFEHSKYPSGVSSAMVYPKKKVASLSVVMKEGTWKRGPEAIKKFFQDTVLAGFRAIVEEAERREIPVAGDALLKDVERVLRKL